MGQVTLNVVGPVVELDRPTSHRTLALVDRLQRCGAVRYSGIQASTEERGARTVTHRRVQSGRTIVRGAAGRGNLEHTSSNRHGRGRSLSGTSESEREVTAQCKSASKPYM
ncbi:hypothetical protein CBL_13571 [Carabus blaptoides fortunei]